MDKKRRRTEVSAPFFLNAEWLCGSYVPNRMRDNIRFQKTRCFREADDGTGAAGKCSSTDAVKGFYHGGFRCFRHFDLYREILCTFLYQQINFIEIGISVEKETRSFSVMQPAFPKLRNDEVFEERTVHVGSA